VSSILPASVNSVAITRTGKTCITSFSELYVAAPAGVWERRPSLPGNPPISIYCMKLDPVEPEKLYLGTSQGVYVTPDFGASWSTLNNGLTMDSWGNLYDILSLVFAPQNPQILYAGTNEGILKSVNGGLNWSLVTSVCRNVMTLEVDPLAPDTVYAGSDSYEGGIYRTVDAGLNWEPLGLSGKKVRAIALRTTAPRLLYAGTRKDVFTYGDLYMSEDNGQSWTVVRNGCTYGSVQSVLLGIGSPDAVVLGTEDGIYRSEDRGTTWSTLNSALVESGEIYKIDVDPQAPNRLLVGYGSFFYKTNDAGASWRTVTAPEGFSIGRIARAPWNPRVIYGILNDHSLAVSEDSGESWSRLTSTGLSTNFGIQTLALHPTDPSVLYVLHGGLGVAKSTDQGQTWQYRNTGLPESRFGKALAIDPEQPDVLYVSLELRGIYRTTDGGTTWNDANAGLTSINFNQIVINPAVPSTVYASALRIKDTTYPLAWGPGGVYRSTDRGLSWTRCSPNLAPGDDILTLTVDPGQPSAIYAGTDRGELLVSFNEATDWQSFSPAPPDNTSGYRPLSISNSIPRMVYLGTQQGVYSLVPQTFTDVPRSHLFYMNVEKIAARAITAGCESTAYCPDSPVTRAQMSVFLLKAKYGATYAPPAATGMFTDVPEGYWARAWIERLAVEGITAGCGSGMYCPEAPVTRAQMAVFLLKMKYGNSYVPPDPTGTFSDARDGYWAQAWIEQLAREGITAGCGSGTFCPDQPVTRGQMSVFLSKTLGF